MRERGDAARISHLRDFANMAACSTGYARCNGAAAMTTFRSRVASILAPVLTMSLAMAGCGDAEEEAGGPASGDGPTSAPPGEVHLEASADLFAEAPFAARAEADTPGVRATIDVGAWGAATVDARVIATASEGGVVLQEVEGGAEVLIEGGLSLDGHLVVDLPGIDHDGPIPGLDDHEVRFAARRAVALMSADGGAARSDLATAAGPSVELPGIDGRLVLAVGEGSFVETRLVAGCASADEDEVEVRGRLVTSGVLLLQPSLEVAAPVVGVQVIALAEVEVRLEGEAEVILAAHVDTLATREAAGDGLVAGTASAWLPSCQ